MQLDIASAIVAYEQGDLSNEDTLDLFGELISSGLAWQLQGSYGRAAARFIEAGLIDAHGTVMTPRNVPCEDVRRY